MRKVPLFCLCAAVAFLPFEQMFWFQELPSAAKLVGLLCVFGGAFGVAVGHPLRGLSKLMWLRVALTCWTCMTFIWSYDVEATVSGNYRILQLLVLVLLLWEFATTCEDQRWILRSMLAGMFVPLCMQVVSLGRVSRWEENAESLRLGGGGHDVNYLAMMFAASILVAIYLAKSPGRFDRALRLLYWAYVPTAVVGTLLTGSRGGVYCLLVAVVFGMFLGGVSVRRIVQVVAYLAFLGAALLVAYYIVPAAVRIRMGEFGSQAETLNKRIWYWQLGLRAFLSQPLVGVGFSAFRSAIIAVTGESTGVAHNLMVSILVESGIVGFVAFCVFLSGVFWAVWKMPKREKYMWLGVLCVWFVGSMGVGSQNEKFGWVFQVMALCHAAALRGVRTTRPRPRPRMVALRTPLPHRPPAGGNA